MKCKGQLMVKTIRYFSICLLLISSSSPVFSESWTNYGSITEIYSFASREKTYIGHDNFGDALSECATNDYIVLDNTKPMSSEILSILLAAHSTNNTKIILLVDGCDVANRAVIDAVRVK